MKNVVVEMIKKTKKFSLLSFTVGHVPTKLHLFLISSFRNFVRTEKRTDGLTDVAENSTCCHHSWRASNEKSGRPSFSGRSFHSLRPMTEKLLSPNLVWIRRTKVSELCPRRRAVPCGAVHYHADQWCSWGKCPAVHQVPADASPC